MLYFSDSVLKTEPSTRRISRRMTLSRVVVLPMNEMRLTKNCLPSDNRIVTSTIGFRPFEPFEALEAFEPFEAFEPSEAFTVAAGGAGAGAGAGALPSVATGARPSFFGLRSG